MASTGSAAAFIKARDFLLRHRTDYTTAYRDFRWPQLGEFNWALAAIRWPIGCAMPA